LEFNVPFQHKYGYIRDEPFSDKNRTVPKCPPAGRAQVTSRC